MCIYILHKYVYVYLYHKIMSFNCKMKSFPPATETPQDYSLIYIHNPSAYKVIFPTCNYDLKPDSFIVLEILK